jgi:hypothetical protein
MAQETKRTDIKKKTVVYRIAGMDAVTVQRDIEYRSTAAGPLTLDVYRPSTASGAALPAVIFALGFSDAGAQRMLGCKFKEMGSYISWAQLVAASGMAAITYSTNEPAADIYELLQYIRRDGQALGIDPTRVGVWACSGNVPLALSVLMEEGREPIKCAVLCYGYTLDLDGATSVAGASKKWGFVNPCGGKSVANLPQEMPLFVARAGQDAMPGLNQSVDAFLTEALTYNLQITLANHPSGPHAFDLEHDSETSREIIRQILGFLKGHLPG